MLMRSKAKPQTLTGVGAVLTADHRSQYGEIHSHTWKITVWFSYDGYDAVSARRDLEGVLKHHQGKCLPDNIAWAETLAAWIAGQMEDDWRHVVRVTVERTEERLYAEWRTA